MSGGCVVGVVAQPAAIEGVLSHLGDPGASYLISGGDVTAAGTSQVQVGPAVILSAGVEVTLGAESSVWPGAVVRGERVFVPRGADRLEVGDDVILFVHQEHVPTVQLLFPGRGRGRP